LNLKGYSELQAKIASSPKPMPASTENLSSKTKFFWPH